MTKVLDLAANAHAGSPARRAGVRFRLLFLGLMPVLAASAYAAFFRPAATVEWEDLRLRVIERAVTGHQRAGRVAFDAAGRHVLVACPRYDRLVIHEVDSAHPRLKLRHDIALEGKPMAIVAHGDRALVLQRPGGDARHLEPGYWQEVDPVSGALGPRVPVGYDPDDIALVDEGNVALVLLSGHAEGETGRPDPALVAFDITGGTPVEVGRVTLSEPGDEPVRIVLSERTSHAAVLLRRGELLGIDLTDPLQPRPTGRATLESNTRPLLSVSPQDVIAVPAASLGELVPIPVPGTPPSSSLYETPLRRVSALAAIEPESGRVLLYAPSRVAPPVEIPLSGPGRLGSVEALHMAYHESRGLLAVTDKSGGVTLIALESAVDLSSSTPSAGRPLPRAPASSNEPAPPDPTTRRPPAE